MFEAIAAAIALVGTILGLGISASQQKKNREEEEKLQQQQNEFNAKQAEIANVRQRQNYTDLESPQAKMQQIKEAGQSPSYYYAGNGLSGALRTAPQATASPVAPYYAGDTMGLMLAGLGGNMADVVKKASETKKTENESKVAEQQRENLETQKEQLKAEIEKTDKETALLEWKEGKLISVSKSTVDAWSSGKSWGDSYANSKGESEAKSFGWNANLGVTVAGTGGNVGGGKNEGKSTSTSTSESTSKSGSDSKSQSNSESQTIQGLLYPQIEKTEEGYKIKGLIFHVFTGDFDAIKTEFRSLDF